MSRLFWKLFLVIWLSIAGLVCMLIVLTNVFHIQPPQREVARVVNLYFVDAARELVARGDVAGLDGLKKAALLAHPPITLEIAQAPSTNCNLINSVLSLSSFVRNGEGCFELSATSSDQGPTSFVYLAMPFVLAAVASLIASFWLASYLAGPIMTLKNGLNALAHGDFFIRIGKTFGSRKDEISNLGLDFDSTAAKLQALQQSQQRLYQDVSHELRSPLSRLQASIGVLRQNPTKLDPMLSRMNREIERLDALVGEILTLAQLSSGYVSTLERQKIDVIDLLTAIVDDATFEAIDGVGVEMRGVSSFVCNVNGELIYRALENVVRNAVKYTAPGTTVIVEARVTQDASRRRLHITVVDFGPGVPPELIDQIFHPFNRGVETGDVKGHGLGLAIARQSLEIHGGRIWAENMDQRGLKVSIEMVGD